MTCSDIAKEPSQGPYQIKSIGLLNSFLSNSDTELHVHHSVQLTKLIFIEKVFIGTKSSAQVWKKCSLLKFLMIMEILKSNFDVF